MKVILLSDVKNVGKKDEVVEVADGYARNFLLKRKLAVPQTQGSMKVLGMQKEEERLHELELEKEAEAVKERLKGIVLEFQIKTGNNGRSFGTVSTKQVDLFVPDAQLDDIAILRVAHPDRKVVLMQRDALDDPAAERKAKVRRRKADERIHGVKGIRVSAWFYSVHAQRSIFPVQLPFFIQLQAPLRACAVQLAQQLLLAAGRDRDLTFRQYPLLQDPSRIIGALQGIDITLPCAKKTLCLAAAYGQLRIVRLDLLKQRLPLRCCHGFDDMMTHAVALIVV